MRIIRKILWLIFMLILAGALIVLGYYLASTKNTTLNPDKLVLSEKNIVIYDKDGEEVNNVASFSFQQTVSINEMQSHTKNAFVATEDKRFYSHHGFDIKRIIKAALNNVKAGSFKEGASTISQQLIKNTHLSQEKTIKRKLREWKLTRALEKKYTKSEILEKYLNTIYFGHSCFGIQSAANFYFGKNANELSVSESAILAGLVKSPNNYSPFNNPEQCLKRRNCVLTLMKNNGFINDSQLNNALNEPLPITPTHHETNAGFMQFVFDELTNLSEQYHFTVGGKIEISTFLDVELQQHLDNITRKEIGCEKTILIADNRTHGYKACVASARNIRRLPGSLIKPLLVYAPAIEENLLSPATPILDEKVDYNGYSPENYDKRYHGYVSARECVEKSLNVPAVKILSSLGVNKAVSYLDKMELRVDKDDFSLALALGGMKQGFTLKELVSAYSSLSGEGVKNDCGFIKNIKINDVFVYEKKDMPIRIFSKESAYLMTDMLKTAAKNGTAKKLRSLPFDIAAKTGTVGTEKGNTDAYAISYTPWDCVAVWLGNKNNDCIEYTGGGLPCNYLLELNEYLYKTYQEENKKIPNFSRPKNVVSITLDKPSYYDTHTLLLADTLSPNEYRFTELFKSNCIPLKSNDSFSNPSISPPSLSVENGKVVLRFDKNSPKYYTYTIKKYDYATHTTVYSGEFIETFIDENIEKGKTYIYTILPAYKQQKGKQIILPSVSTKHNQTINDKNMMQQDWWEY
ncbi:MAG: transglycosylase domain-containing protein [Clostridia bacterium]|nr:transglycosylase domain-containing protein [Clostridia bacterium]